MENLPREGQGRPKIQGWPHNKRSRPHLFKVTTLPLCIFANWKDIGDGEGKGGLPKCDSQDCRHVLYVQLIQLYPNSPTEMNFRDISSTKFRFLVLLSVQIWTKSNFETFHVCIFIFCILQVGKFDFWHFSCVHIWIFETFKAPKYMLNMNHVPNSRYVHPWGERNECHYTFRVVKCSRFSYKGRKPIRT